MPHLAAICRWVFECTLDLGLLLSLSFRCIWLGAPAAKPQNENNTIGSPARVEVRGEWEVLRYSAVFYQAVSPTKIAYLQLKAVSTPRITSRRRSWAVAKSRMRPSYYWVRQDRVLGGRRDFLCSQIERELRIEGRSQPGADKCANGSGGRDVLGHA